MNSSYWDHEYLSGALNRYWQHSRQPSGATWTSASDKPRRMRTVTSCHGHALCWDIGLLEKSFGLQPFHQSLRHPSHPQADMIPERPPTTTRNCFPHTSLRASLDSTNPRTGSSASLAAQLHWTGDSES